MSLRYLFFRLVNYLSYQLKAKGRHSVHSPFVYQFINECIIPARKLRFSDIEKLRNQFLSNHQLIEVVDLKNQTSRLMRISSVAATSVSSARFSSFLYLLARHIKANSALETGTSLGINTLYLSKSDLKKITTIEWSQIMASLARKNLPNRRIRLITGDMYKVLEEEIVRIKPDFYFFDADHHSSAIAFCIDLVLRHTPALKCIVVKDIYWSKDMKEMWQALVQDPRFVLSIDLFHAGVLFPKLDMPKQHFTLHF